MKNLPEKFLEEMKELLKDEYDEFLSSYEEKRYSGLRANAIKISADELESICGFLGDKIPWSDTGYYFENDERPAKSPLYHAGLYYIQEPSAMSVVNNIDIEEGMRVLDICAAPGGKTINIASKLKNTGMIVANDISPARTKALLKNIELFGVTNAVVTSENQEKLLQMFPEFFDRIIIDAPCSGEGMFRKDEMLINSWERSRKESVEIQRSLLEHCSKMLKPGGRIIYSTCTFNMDENELAIKTFIDNNSEFKLIDIPKINGFTSLDILPEAARLFPHRVNGEGHFLCLMQKEGQIEDNSEIKMSKKHFDRKKLPEAYIDFEKKNMNIELNGSFTLSENRLYMEAYPAPFAKGFKVLRNGLYLGEIKSSGFTPSQAFMMAMKQDDFKNILDIDQHDAQAAKYLKGETISALDKKDGFHAVAIEGHIVGYGKVQNEKLKNGYNKNWRMI